MVTTRFTGFKCASRRLAYAAPLMASGKSIGRVTAYEISPYLECGVGFALLDSADNLDSHAVTINDRDGEPCPVEFVELPFYDAAKNIPRGQPSADDIND